MRKLTILATAVAVSMTTFIANAHAATTNVNFKDKGTYTAASFSEDILTVTSNTGGVGLLFFNGIGVEGGLSDSLVEPGETLDFSFSSSVENVILNFFPVISNFNMRYEAFDGANSLGTVIVNAIFQDNPFSLTGFFGNASITSFTMTGIGGIPRGDRLGAITYDTVAPVPLPAGLPLLLVGIGGLGLIARRTRKTA